MNDAKSSVKGGCIDTENDTIETEIKKFCELVEVERTRGAITQLLLMEIAVIILLLHTILSSLYIVDMYLQT